MNLSVVQCKMDDFKFWILDPIPFCLLLGSLILSFIHYMSSLHPATFNEVTIMQLVIHTQIFSVSKGLKISLLPELSP